MSHADDIAEGDFCYKCGEYLGDGFGCMQLCPACEEEEQEEK